MKWVVHSAVKVYDLVSLEGILMMNSWMRLVGVHIMSLHLISILPMFNQCHFCVFFLFIYLLLSDFSSVWTQHVSQRFSEVVRAYGKTSQEEILIDQMPDTPHSSLEVCFSIICSILYMKPHSILNVHMLPLSLILFYRAFHRIHFQSW